MIVQVIFSKLLVSLPNFPQLSKKIDFLEILLEHPFNNFDPSEIRQKPTRNFENNFEFFSYWGSKYFTVILQYGIKRRNRNEYVSESVFYINR